MSSTVNPFISNGFAAAVKGNAVHRTNVKPNQIATTPLDGFKPADYWFTGSNGDVRNPGGFSALV